jgi:hypothetical protein
VKAGTICAPRCSARAVACSRVLNLTAKLDERDTQGAHGGVFFPVTVTRN